MHDEASRSSALRAVSTAVLVTAASALVTVGTPSAAQADAACPAGLIWTLGHVDPSTSTGPIWWADVLSVVSVTAPTVFTGRHVTAGQPLTPL